MTPVLGDHLLTQPNGRQVGYSIYGAPSGAAVVNCHGGLVSGHDVGPADLDARELGLCVISPDRPGVGRTTRLPGYDMLTWVRTDLLPLLEHLRVDQFTVMGWSEGGQYALATAYAVPARVERCAVIAGCLPLDNPSVLRGTNRMDRALMALSTRRPLAVRASFAVTHTLALHAPSVLLRMIARSLPVQEAAAVRARGPWLPTLLGEGASDTQGGIDEYRALGAPWGFTPEEIVVPVHVFQGGADTLVPAEWGRTLARRIPGADLTLYPGEGHFIALTRRRDVLEYLAEPARSTAAPED